MTIASLLQKAQKEQLRPEMELFLAFLLGVSRLDLIAYGEREVPVEKLAELMQGWSKLKQGYPIQYITNHKEFYALDLYVNESVLVPRGTTEELVDHAFSELDRLKHEDQDYDLDSARVLELGTGSGAISIAMKHTRPLLELTAVDVSSDALVVASKNCIQHDVSIELIDSDLMKSVTGEFDLIVTNLPYIGTQEHNYVTEEVVQYEPSLALFGGDDGFELYRELFSQLQSKDWRAKLVIGEFGFSQGLLARKVCEALMPDYSFELKQDLEGLDRFFVLRYRPNV